MRPLVLVWPGRALAACGARTPVAPTAAATTAATPADPWDELFLHTPYPFTSPLPAAAVSALDGVYVKLVDTGTPTVHCVRCPEYAPYDGLWKLSFDDGVFRIYHAGPIGAAFLHPNPRPDPGCSTTPPARS
jgi:hypothetical protein